MTGFPKWSDVRADVVAGAGGEEAVAEARKRNHAYIELTSTKLVEPTQGHADEPEPVHVGGRHVDMTVGPPPQR
jgi:hypothetical protein